MEARMRDSRLPYAANGDGGDSDVQIWLWNGRNKTAHNHWRIQDLQLVNIN